MSDTKSKQGKAATDDMIAALAEGLGMPPKQVSRKDSQDQPAKGGGAGAAKGSRKGRRGKRRKGGQKPQQQANQVDTATADGETSDDSPEQIEGGAEEQVAETEEKVAVESEVADSGVGDDGDDGGDDDFDDEDDDLADDDLEDDGEDEQEEDEPVTAPKTEAKSKSEIELEMAKMELERMRLELEVAKLKAAAATGAAVAAPVETAAEEPAEAEEAEEEEEAVEPVKEDPPAPAKEAEKAEAAPKTKKSKKATKQAAPVAAEKVEQNIYEEAGVGHFLAGGFSGFDPDSFEDDDGDGVDIAMLAKQDEKKLIVMLVGILVGVLVLGFITLVFFGSRTLAKLEREDVEHAGMWDVLTHFDTYQNDIKQAQLQRTRRETLERTPVYGYLQLVCDPPQADIYVRCEPSDHRCNNVGTSEKPQWSDHYVPTGDKKECTQHQDCRDCREPTDAEIHYEIHKAGDLVCTFPDDECREGTCWQPLRTAIEAQRPTEVQGLYIGTMFELEEARKYHVTLRKQGWLPSEFTITHSDWSQRPDPGKEDRVFMKSVMMEPDPNAPEEVRKQVDDYIEKNRVVEGDDDRAKAPAGRRGGRRR